MALLRLLMIVGLLLALTGPVGAKEKLSVAYLDEDSHRAVFHAIEEGILKSDVIDVETRALNIPALIQATGTKQFDVVQTAVVAVPQFQQRGVHLKILSVALRAKEQAAAIFVRADSPLKTPADLKGKSLAVEALGATVTTYMRYALFKKHGLNVDLKNGDVKFEQIPRDVIPGLLAQRRIDAGYLYHTPAYRFRRDPANYRVLHETIPDFIAVTGQRPVTALMVAYPETIEKKGAALREFNRLLKASMEYARSNPAAWEAVAKKYSTNADFLKDWFTNQYDFPATINEELAKGIAVMWQATKELGDLAQVPDVNQHIWWEGVAR